MSKLVGISFTYQKNVSKIVGDYIVLLPLEMETRAGKIRNSGVFLLHYVDMIHKNS